MTITPMKISMLLVCVALMTLMTVGCAIDTAPDGMVGYFTCETNADCEGKGICIEAEMGKYCGVECTINKDCEDENAAATDPKMICTNNLCVAEDTQD